MLLGNDGVSDGINEGVNDGAMVSKVRFAHREDKGYISNLDFWVLKQS